MAGYEEKHQAILPYKSTSTLLTKLCQSQRIADLGILKAIPAPKESPSRNTRSKAQIHTITQEAILACINTYGDITGNIITPCSTARRQFLANILQAVLDKSTGQLMEMRHLLINPKYKELWGKLYTKELARLAQGIPGVSKGTKTLIIIKRDEITADCRCDTTYAHVCVNYRPKKDDPNRARLTVSGNLIHILSDVSTPTVNMVTVKLHLNSVISTKGARYCTIDLNDFYLNIPMVRPEYMRMKLKDIPIVAPDGTIYVKIQKGM